MPGRKAVVALLALFIAVGAIGLAPSDIAAHGPVFIGRATAATMSRAEARRQAAELSALGRDLFFDPALSASGRMACATCHGPAHAFAPANALPVQQGGADLRQPGLRAVPSLKYLQAVPQFTEHYFDSEDDADESVDNGPSGGLMWDGRADSGHAQAAFPLLSPFEMGNATPDTAVANALRGGYGARLQAIYGDGVLDDPKVSLAGITKALEVFQQDYRTFYPYSSKYDAYLAGKATLTPQEARGLELFDEPAKGNCAACHVSRRGNDGTPPQFTDFGLIAIGVPRNPAIPANADPACFDLGLCGPLGTDLRGRVDYCGLFRTPSLRNVATRQTFFHNGAFHDLRKVVEFYVQRDTHPERWYPRNPDGSVRKFDDLPAAYHANLNLDPPFDRHPGEAPALSESEIDDVVAFLRTLTDGYVAGDH
jgi:cytochrome c peroxidase